MDLKILKDSPPWDWPEDAGKLFLKVLGDQHTNGSDRLLAAELAGDYTVINDELADALLSMVSNDDETEELRGKAVISLGPALENAYMMGFEDADDILIFEETFHKIQKRLRQLYMDADVPKEVRRRVLEASVRAPQDWHQKAVRAAYDDDDEAWRLTAVFCMRFIQGFDDQILEALNSDNPDIQYQAVCAAGDWEVDAAWPHIAALLTADQTDKSLLLAAIDAVASIRPQEAGVILVDLTNSDDEDIAEAAHEAMAMAEGPWSDDFDDDDEDGYVH